MYHEEGDCISEELSATRNFSVTKKVSVTVGVLIVKEVPSQRKYQDLRNDPSPKTTARSDTTGSARSQRLFRSFDICQKHLPSR
jgi:hypothetical protein